MWPGNNPLYLHIIAAHYLFSKWIHKEMLSIRRLFQFLWPKYGEESLVYKGLILLDGENKLFKNWIFS